MSRILFIAIVISLGLTSCSKTIDNLGTCTDGVKNQGEQGVDCGGPCGAPCPSCADGIMNQNETAVDCGGQCDPCYPSLSAKIDNVQWSSTSRNAFISGPGIIRIYGTNQQNNITLFYSGVFTEGSTPTGNSFTGEMRDENGNLYSSINGGSITFTTFDTTARKVSGIYNFTGKDTVSNQFKVITSGVFTELTY
jgi:hypothetical protein